ncbi:MAG: serine hydrolase [Mycobacterium sp.]
MRRRHFVFGLGVAAAAMVASPTTAVAEPGTPVDAQIEALQRRYNASIGLYATNPANGRVLALRDSEMFAVCSTFKTYAAAGVLQRAERGELSRQDARHEYAEGARQWIPEPVDRNGPHRGVASSARRGVDACQPDVGALLADALIDGSAAQHIFNPEWPPHAKFHDAQYITSPPRPSRDCIPSWSSPSW